MPEKSRPKSAAPTNLIFFGGKGQAVVNDFLAEPLTLTIGRDGKGVRYQKFTDRRRHVDGAFFYLHVNS